MKILIPLSVISFVLYLSGWAEKASATTQWIIASPILILVGWTIIRFLGMGYANHEGMDYSEFNRKMVVNSREHDERMYRAAEIANQRASGRFLGEDIHFDYTITDDAGWDEWLHARYLKNNGPKNGVHMHLVDKRSKANKEKYPL